MLDLLNEHPSHDDFQSKLMTLFNDKGKLVAGELWKTIVYLSEI